MNCKICSSKTEKIKDIKKDIYYYKCKECDFVFIDEKNIYSTEDEKVRYLKHNNRFENNGYVAMLKDFIDKYILCYKGKVKDILDFGCGYMPVLAKLLEEQGFDVDIYDKYFFPEKIYLKKSMI